MNVVVHLFSRQWILFLYLQSRNLFTEKRFLFFLSDSLD